LHPRTVVLALGGSASTDAGMGMLTALGAVFTNDQGRPLIGCGEELSSVVAADLTHLDGLLLGGRIVSGASYFLDLLHFDDLVTDADLVITGEGRIDDQTLQGKLPFVVAQRSTPRPVHVVVGRNDLTKGVEAHFAHIHQLSDHTSADSRSDPRLSTSILTEIGRAIATTLASQPVAR
jgi:glycerate kinase